MKKKDNLSDLAQGFSLLSDPTRLAIIRVLAKGSMNVQGLCKTLGLKQSTMSHHLAILRLGRLVNGVRTGPAVIYSTDKATMKDLVKGLSGLIPA